MKKSIVILLCLAFVAAAGSCSKKSGPRFSAEDDSLAYVIGLNVGRNLLKMDSTLSVEGICDGIRDVFEHNEQLSDAAAKEFFLRYVNVGLPEKILAYEEQFLDDLAKSNRDFVRTATGLTYSVDVLGDQDLVPTSDRDTVEINYLIKDIDGREIFSSVARKQPLRTSVGSLLPGMRESVKLIGRGGQINAWVPAAAAYGVSGDKKLGVGANATLYYEIELVGVEKYANRFR